jgi:hypothetical protein
MTGTMKSSHKLLRARAAAALGFLLLLVSPAHATEVGTSRSFGLGLQVGEPTAIVGKAFLGRGNAIDFGIGFWGLGWRGRCRGPEDHWHDCHNRHDYFSVHADWLWEETIRQQPFRLDWHVGIGGRYANWYEWEDGASAVLARVPLGLDFAFNRPSWLEAFIEIAPGLLVVPGLDLWIDVGLGVRAYF